MAHQIMCTSCFCKVVDDVCHDGQSEKNLFVITNKGKVVYIQPLKFNQ